MCYHLDLAHDWERLECAMCDIEILHLLLGSPASASPTVSANGYWAHADQPPSGGTQKDTSKCGKDHHSCGESSVSTKMFEDLKRYQCADC